MTVSRRFPDGFLTGSRLFLLLKFRQKRDPDLTGGDLLLELYNPNPTGKNVGDCTVRAIAKATGAEWDDVYLALCSQGFRMKDMPSANAVWGAHLRKLGFTRTVIPDSCPECYTVEEFATEHSNGIHILALSGHVVCVKNGVIFDSWDSSREIPLYRWERND